MANEAPQQRISAPKAGALFAASILIVLLGVLYAKVNSTIVLLTAGTVCIALCMSWGVKWADIERDILASISAMLPAILILLAVGLLVGVWIACGTVPLMIYYGLRTLTPSVFLVAALVLCTIMSVCMGTSWGTIGTVGVALMGVSAGLEIPLAYTAGAIVTGAIFGDKLSPLSDTTVMASAVSGVDIVDHIKYMLWTTIPPYLISLLLYLFLGTQVAGHSFSGEGVSLIVDTLEKNFNMNPALLLPPVAVLALILMKKPALPVFALGVLLGVLLAFTVQGHGVQVVATALYRGYNVSTNVEIVDKMLLRGGLSSMFSTHGLLFAAAIFGAPLRTAGVVTILLEQITKYARTSKSMQMLAFGIHALFFSITGSYYVTFAVLAPMLRPLYDHYGLNRTNLSRMLEDSGTAFAPIVPWSVTGAFCASTLGVATGEYILYAPLTYLGMVFLAFYNLTGFKIATVPKGDAATAE